jgi:hypothetical protein
MSDPDDQAVTATGPMEPGVAGTLYEVTDQLARATPQLRAKAGDIAAVLTPLTDAVDPDVTRIDEADPAALLSTADGERLAAVLTEAADQANTLAASLTDAADEASGLAAVLTDESTSSDLPSWRDID